MLAGGTLELARDVVSCDRTKKERSLTVQYLEKVLGAEFVRLIQKAFPLAVFS